MSKEIKPCHRQDCNNFFTRKGNRGLQIYCSTECCDKAKQSKDKDYYKNYRKTYESPNNSSKIKMPSYVFKNKYYDSL